MNRQYRFWGSTMVAIVVLGLFAPLAHSQRRGGFRGGGVRAGGVRAGGYRGGSVRTGSYRAGGSVVGPSYRSTSGSRTYRSTPYRGSTYSGGRRTTTVTPGGASTRATGGFSHTTRGGYNITGGGTAGRAVGPRGGTAGGAAKGVKVTTPTGQSYYRGTARGGAVGPNGGVRVGSGRTAGTTGPYGTRGGSVTRRAGVTPGGSVVGSRTATGYRRFPTDAGLSRYTRSTVRTRGYSGTRYRSGTVVRTQAGYVRRGFTYRSAFSVGWYRRYPRAWRPVRWRYTAATVWLPCTWAVLYPWCGYPAQPIYYDYGTTVVYQNDNVYVQGEQLATQEEYAQQATTIANVGRTSPIQEQDEWQPLGVFAMVQGEEKNSNTVFQLAVNKKGVIRGNYYNGLSDVTLEVYGSVDPKTQRAAWTIGEKKTPVFEAGIANLTKEETTMLVHMDGEETQQYLLVRLEEPETQSGDSGATTPSNG